ncbi:Vesicle-fusing ATPase 1-like protein [Leptotrombidium deliense]|uniref:Vesicle-fusing ATPase n=1 Tax=Leptotrombidium deliense TaxID=299467 RepID=A0A443RU95_9ACAR|nr:Vesicle-fusing ATPase 1-like protein [Leptotrombidium deliense]
MGIGGLKKEFEDIFINAFSSRMYSEEDAEECGLEAIKGILLYGPPGTGKTTIASQIVNMVNASVKIVNGPEIMDKYFGESEKNIRDLFKDAEQEHNECKLKGTRSGLHIIVFDEIDAICRRRGSAYGSANVYDSMVNQLLSIFGGIKDREMKNILVIGMTNRIDMIDEALLRAGRFQIKLELPLPDEEGREQIFNIHAKKYKDKGKLAPDVDFKNLVSKTRNYSGAEIEDLVKFAEKYASKRLIPFGKTVSFDPEANKNFKIR